MSQIFDAYFAGARAYADVNESIDPSSSDPATTPIAVAAAAVAELTGIDNDTLWATVYAKLAPDVTHDLMGRPHAPVLIPVTDGERLAVGCMWFVAAWEHLQYVHGATARQLMQEAVAVLSGHGLSVDDGVSDAG